MNHDLLVLVVDDHVDTLTMLAEFLTFSGHRVLTAANGDEAIELAAKHQPDVVLLDLAMPRMSGIDVARHLRESGVLPRALLVATTGRTGATAEAIALSSGCDRVLLKPYDMQEILALVRDF